jgi:hypothetical protein
MASAAAGNFIAINSLRGGMNNTLRPHMLPDDQCVLAMNVEFFHSTLGERRLGTDKLDLTGSGLDAEATIVHLSEWFPTNDARFADLWAVAATPGVSVTIAVQDISLTWFPITPDDPPIPTVPQIYGIQAQPLNGLDFFAYYSAVDRLHVWDGTWRRTGIPAPVTAPTGANEGSGSTYTTTRYFRVRFTKMTGSTVTLTLPPPIAGETITDYEIEASLDNANFYRIATQSIAITSYTDETQDSAFYSDEGPLSEAIGSYLLQQSAKYLLVDGDRLILVSHWTDPGLMSRVWWTPVVADPGAGNSERVPIVTTGGLPIQSFKDLGNYDGGGITGVSKTANGTFYVFKFSAVYQFLRTQDDTNAYNVFQMSSNAGPRGAMEGSIVSAVDEYGQGCIYFLDPWIGPSRLGNMGMEKIEGLRDTWERVNQLANVISARGVYYPDKQQVIWWVSVDGADTPTMVIRLQISEVQESAGQATRGFSLADGVYAQARAVTQRSEIVQNGVNNFRLTRRPIIGLPAPLFIMRTDTGDTDYGTKYFAEILSKPYLPVGIMNQWETMVGAIMGEPSDKTARLQMQAVRDFDKERSKKIVHDFVPKANETQVIRQIDNLHMSEAYAIQFRFSDPEPDPVV